MPMNISEFHYENAGTDTGEFVEIRVTAGQDISAAQVLLYNGVTGNAYRTINLDGTGLPTGVTVTQTTVGGFDYYVISFPDSTIQNAASSADGIALVDGGVVQEFLSYEGTFTASTGAAAGLTSTDVGVSQSNTTPTGSSLQFLGGSWVSTATATAGAENACFWAGTMIATPDGEKAVESLRAGDLVTLADGSSTAINWLGRQTLSIRFGEPLRTWPIRIKAGAIDGQTPVRDLLLSADHALFIDGVLVNAGALVNGVTILREKPATETFVYYHIETEKQELILADGALAETFVDNVDRLRFDNWDERNPLKAYGDRIVELPYPRAKSVRQVPASIRERIESVACVLSSSAA